MTPAIERARGAFARGAWGDAYALLAQVDLEGADDFERLAVAAHLTGRDDEASRAWELAHLERARTGDPDGSARCAVWLAFGLMLRGDMARASGWLGRATHLLDETAGDFAARGYLKMPEFLDALVGGDAARAAALADDIVLIAQRFDDEDLRAIGMLGQGQAAVALGEIASGMRVLDEVMVAVASGEISPIPAGIVYCAVIEACIEVMDLRRAAEWTEALSHWCEAQPDLVPYRGQCLVHRSQVLQAHGAWSEALTEAERARRHLSDPAHPALGLALYQQGELHRLRGDITQAEQAYRAASEQGRDPAPGLALLRLEQGKVESAVAAVRRMVEESRGRLDHATMLAAEVEIMLAAGDVDAAAAATGELGDIARRIDSPLLRSIHAYAAGSVHLARHDATSALPSLRAALAGWRQLGMPFDEARARVLIALACRDLGDADVAALELDAARSRFEMLGARPDLARVAQLVDSDAPPSPTRRIELTQRECEVIRLVATGRTDREIADVLVISEHTVGRHLQNIFTKLGLSSRAAATAYAYEHGLV